MRNLCSECTAFDLNWEVAIREKALILLDLITKLLLVEVNFTLLLIVFTLADARSTLEGRDTPKDTIVLKSFPEHD